MDPVTAIAAFNLAVKMAEVLAPKIEAMLKSGEVPAEQQAEVRASYLKLRGLGHEAFTGPEWQTDSKQ